MNTTNYPKFKKGDRVVSIIDMRDYLLDECGSKDGLLKGQVVCVHRGRHQNNSFHDLTVKFDDYGHMFMNIDELRFDLAKLFEEDV